MIPTPGVPVDVDTILKSIHIGSPIPAVDVEELHTAITELGTILDGMTDSHRQTLIEHIVVGLVRVWHGTAAPNTHEPLAKSVRSFICNMGKHFPTDTTVSPAEVIR